MGTDRSWKLQDIPQDCFCIVPVIVCVQNHVADFTVNLIMLGCEVNFVLRKNTFLFPELAGQVALDLDETGAVRAGRMVRLRKVNRT